MVRSVGSAVLLMLALQSALAVSQEGAGDVPSVMIVMLARNKAPYLPYTLTQLGRLDYPKERLSLWIASDHNQDRTAAVLHAWLERHGSLYWDVEVSINSSSPPLRTDERSAVHMSAGRRRAVTHMKQAALQSARRRGAEFVWFLDADVILYDRAILRHLLDMRNPIVAPMLRSTGGYTNFQSSFDGNMCDEDNGRLSEIYSRQQRGCFTVPSLVRSCVLVDLRDPRTAGLTFLSETGPEQQVRDDAVSLAISARRSGLKMTVCNQEEFGLMPPPLTATQQLSDEWRSMINIKLASLVNRPLPVEHLMRLFLPPPPRKTRLGFDLIYTIGLQRRPERWKRQKACFNELGMEVVRVHAVDGRNLTDAFLKERNISSPPPFYLNKGEIGCFLSHYGVWQDMLDSGLERVLVLENDAHPTAEFPERLQQLVDKADRLQPQWDFIYLFREHADLAHDEPVEGAEQLVRPGFCYSAMAYALTRRGAEKLLAGRPLENMLSVDLYIPIMAGTHPNRKWLKRFPGTGTLNTFSSREHLIEPALVRGELGYISDTTEVDALSAQIAVSQTATPTRNV